NLGVEASGGFRVGKRRPLAVTRRVDVVGSGGVRGTVVASVPLDAALARRLEARSGLEQDDHVILLEGGRIVAGLPPARGRFDLPLGSTHTVSFAGTKYRALVAGTPDQNSATLGVVTPQARIDAANRDATNRLLIGL